MNRSHIFALCLIISVVLHVWGLNREWGGAEEPPPPLGDEEIIIPADFAIAAAMPAAAGLALEQGVDTGDDSRTAESAARRRRRLAQRQYFKQIRQAIERRKFQQGGDLSGLIGNVLYSFRIQPDDTFSHIRVRRSSGDSLLDNAARKAIVSASGKVKRPKVIRGQTYTFSVAVKYQLNM